ncbi:MAG: hypothetical protein U0165_09405 [Polyangiaceae bacterium]
MSDFSKYPILLNGRDALGRVIYAYKTRAFVYRPYPTGPGGPPIPSGSSGIPEDVPIPEHMNEEEFRSCDGGELRATADGKKCKCFYTHGNPPFPPHENPCPPCAEAMARAAATSREGESQGLVSTVLSWLTKR